MDWKIKFAYYLATVKNDAPLTAVEYGYDAQQYAESMLKAEMTDISEVPFSKECITTFAASLRISEKSENTISRKVHGVLAFWEYCYRLGFAEKPVPYKELGLRIKKSKNPTEPLTSDEYTKFMGELYVELQYFF